MNFPLKRFLLRMNNFKGVLHELWQQMKEQTLYRTHALQNNHFWIYLPLTACGTFSFLEIFMHWISNYTCKDTIFKRISSSYYGISVNSTNRYHYTRVFLKKVFSNHWKNLQESTQIDIRLKPDGCNEVNMTICFPLGWS